MAITFPLLNGHRISFSEAKLGEVDIIQRIAWCSGARSVAADLELRSEQGRVSGLVSHHFRIKETRCEVEPTNVWPRGAFNQCVPISIRSTSTDTVSSRVLLRVPMAHKLSGMVDEKIRCEVATYIWMQKNCPEIPIPRLFAFGLPDGRHFTHASLLPWYRRWTRSFKRRICAWLGRPIPSYYMQNPWTHDFPPGYLLLEFIGRGKPLAHSWSPQTDPVKRENLFRGISRLILSLAKVPLDRIGSFTFNPDNETISLTNRPLVCDHVIIENDGAERAIDADQTYETVDAYVADLLTLHDNRFRAQQNAVMDREDCYSQMAIQLIMKAMSHHYPDRTLRRGPFRMQFTDLHQGNLFVDDDWKIIALIDLEWICARSPQMIDIPYWITSKTSLDAVADPDHSREFAEAREYFLSLLKEEEPRICNDIYLSRIMEKAYSSKATWFFHSLDSINVMYHLFEYQLRPQFMPNSIPPEVDVYFAYFWSRGVREIAMQKLQDKEAYDVRLKELYGLATGRADIVGKEQDGS